jgi:hypothetical protein
MEDFVNLLPLSSEYFIPSPRLLPKNHKQLKFTKL